MRRREFVGLVGGAAAWPFAAVAQAPERIFTIGWLGVTSARLWKEGLSRDFLEGLRDLGFAETDDCPNGDRRVSTRSGRLPCVAQC